MQTGIKHSIKKAEATYFLTTTVVEWVDIFTRERYQEIIINTLRFYIHNRGLNVYAFCIMSNHLHMVANTEVGSSLSDIIRDFKKYTSREIIRAIHDEPESRRKWMLEVFSNAADQHSKTKFYKVWQDGNHAIELYNEQFTWTKINYIHQNPVRAGLVTHAEYWKYSSAGLYQEMESVLPEVFPVAAPLNYGL
jgi:REP element-mobilizing transposase RayT